MTPEKYTAADYLALANELARLQPGHSVAKSDTIEAMLRQATALHWKVQQFRLTLMDRNGEEWWQEAGNIESLNHDDDALAMALELAQVIDDDMLPVTHQVLGYNAELESSIFVWDWLREEVRNALLERAR
jgi:hypothetical protein